MEVIGTTIAIVQLTGWCLERLGKEIGPSQYSQENVTLIRTRLEGLNTIMPRVKEYVDAKGQQEIQEQAGVPDNLVYLHETGKHCRAALEIITTHLSQKGWRKSLIGIRFDKRLQAALSSLDEARRVFMLVLSIDTQDTSKNLKEAFDHHSLRTNESLSSIQGLLELQERKLVEADAVGASENLLAQYERVRNWLTSDEDESVQMHERNKEQAHHGSCTWIRQCETFEQWINSMDAPAVIWIAGEHGLGKSILCTKTIEYVRDVGRCAIFHYCRYNNQLDMIHIARSLVLQLFEHAWDCDVGIAALLWEKYATAGSSAFFMLSTLTDAMLLILANLEQSLDRERSPFPTAFLFLDGIDEAAQDSDILACFVDPLLQRLPQGALRIWVSSRRESTLQRKLQHHPTVNPKDHNQQDIRDYLSNVVQQYYEQQAVAADSNNATDSEDDQSSNDSIASNETSRGINQEATLSLMIRRAEGNFFYASLLQGLLKKVPTYHSRLDLHIDRHFVLGSRGFYFQVFKLYEDPDFACRLFSLVTFAKRPLRLEELKDALAIKVHRHGRETWEEPLGLARMFNPLITEHRNGPGLKNSFCQLMHSAVRDFILANPLVLGEQYPIEEDYIADTCLNYLRRERFSRSFSDIGALRRGIVKNHFLTYAAKYWDRHLHAVGGRPSRYDNTCRLLTSSNFQTLLQVQSEAVAHQFSFFPKGDLRYFRKSLPGWLADYKEDQGEASRLVNDFRRFQREWAYFLDSWCCEDGECSTSLRRGNIMLASSGLFGLSSLFKPMRERSPSFVLHQGGLQDMQLGTHEGMWMSRSVAVLAELTNGANGLIHLKLFFWDCGVSHSPIFTHTRELRIQADTCQWSFYDRAVSDKKKRLAQPPRIAFSDDLQVLRVGNLLLRTDQQDKLEPIRDLDKLASDMPKYFQEFTTRGNTLVLCRRQRFEESNFVKLPASETSGEEPSKRAGALYEQELFRSAYQSSTSLQNESSNFSDDGSLSGLSDKDYSSEADASMYESYSEGSTDPGSEAELSLGESYVSSEASVKTSSSSEDQHDDSSEYGSTDEYQDPISDYAQLVINLQTTITGADEDEEYSSSGTESSTSSLTSMPGIIFAPEDGDDPETFFVPRPAIRRTIGQPVQRRDEGRERCSIIVVDLEDSSTGPRELFHFDWKLTTVLYDSPPALHPTKSLLVSPICGGQVLFADYRDKTYFVRHIVPTTTGNRFVSIKVHFSTCGSFLHMACLQAQTLKGKAKAPWEKEKDSSSKIPRRVRCVTLSVLVTTYRLSSRKTTRSPPILLHRVVVDIGDFLYFSISPLAVTFTWSPEHLYIAQSSYKLSVIRVGLFKPKTTEHSLLDEPASARHVSITQPRMTVPLPASAQQRQVYFVPSSELKDSQGRGLVMMGPYTAEGAQGGNPPMFIPLHPNHIWRRTALVPLYSTPPSGMYVAEDDEQGMGGWEVYNGKADQKVKRGNGSLVRKIEPFDPVGDYELENIAIENIGLEY